ncbi:glycosyltransferase [Fontimonas sp. SYSU GA230001]|uniref:glycosyltransferase n=1 Tax=Fontimonas sp. SYSU GA230001 TaxID=3142450 RepID=UPI0032B5B775
MNEDRSQGLELADLRIAVLVPCRDEAPTIARVVEDFRAALPTASIWVFDNNSRDETARLARDAGARVAHVWLQGKGHVVRRMFADVDADLYVLVDGDGTYDAASAPRLVAALLEQSADMVVASRRDVTGHSYRPGHAFGNRALSAGLAHLFGRPCADVLSGYRVFSRRFVKSFPALSAGFETETELTVHALQLNMPVVEIETPYRERPHDSHSKLNTWRDGWRILRTMVELFSAERPLLFYGIGAAVLASSSVILAIPIVLEWLASGLVPRFPTAILSTGLMLLAALSFFSGLILDTVTRGRRELRMLAYLAQPPPFAVGPREV